MQYTLGDKYNSQYYTIVALVGAIVGSENRLHIHLYVLGTKGLKRRSEQVYRSARCARKEISQASNHTLHYSSNPSTTYLSKVQSLVGDRSISSTFFR